MKNFNIEKILNQYSNQDIKVIGSVQIDGQRVQYNFDSKDLDRSDCDEICLELQSSYDKPFLGVRNKSLHNNNGAEIINIVEHTAAELSDMEEGDIITLIDTQTVGGSCDLSHIIAQYQPGDVVAVTYIQGEELITEDAKLGSLSVKTMTWGTCCDDKKGALSSAIDMSVYPNPSNGIVQLTLDSSNNEKVELTISDLSGTVLKTRTLNSFEGTFNQTVDLAEYPNGAYILTVKQGEEIAKEKIILRH